MGVLHGDTLTAFSEEKIMLSPSDFDADRLRVIFLGCEKGEYQPSSTGNALREFLFQLHLRVLERYLPALSGISEEKASQVGADGRTIKQAVDRVAEWDRWTIRCLAAVATGITEPGIVSFRDYLPPLDARAERFSFVGDDDFNTYVLQEISPYRAWFDSRKMATEMAALVVKQAYMVPLRFLGGLRTCVFRMGEVELTLPYGFYLWATEIYRHAVEHTDGLYGD